AHVVPTERGHRSAPAPRGGVHPLGHLGATVAAHHGSTAAAFSRILAKAHHASSSGPAPSKRPRPPAGSPPAALPRSDSNPRPPLTGTSGSDGVRTVRPHAHPHPVSWWHHRHPHKRAHSDGVVRRPQHHLLPGHHGHHPHHGHHRHHN